MKSLLIICSFSLLAVYACSGSGSGSSTDTTGTVTVTTDQTTTDTLGATTPAAPAYKGPGKELIAKSDCLGCHKEYEKLIGPAYSEVAKKYEATAANINLLSEKVLKGGTGVWGNVPMTPHPSLSQDDAKEMVRYILSLK